jgi:hypothetical protein
MNNLIIVLGVECRGRDSNPGRPTPTGPKPVPFGQLGHPCYTLHYLIIYGAIYMILKI